jgi:hypothetical protein
MNTKRFMIKKRLIKKRMMLAGMLCTMMVIGAIGCGNNNSGSLTDDNSNTADEEAVDAYQKVLSGELGPYGKVIPEQTFEVNLSGLGNVIFASYEPEITQSPLPDVSFYILDENGNEIEQLEGSCEDNLRSATDNFCDVQAFSFPDINGDGCKDIITICSYEYIQGPDVGNGFQEVRIYFGAEDGSFHYEKKMSEDAGSALVEI